MYRCEICSRVSSPRVARALHILYRPDGQIERELAVCQECSFRLKTGKSLEVLLREVGVGKSSSPLPSLVNQPVATGRCLLLSRKEKP
jgi:hypothetical protein